MATFITIGYGDRDGYERTDPGVRAKAHEHDQHLREAGAVVGAAGAAIQVRNHGGAGVECHEGAFLRSELPIAGFAILEADDLDQAITMVAQTPCAVAHGVVEVWPLRESGVGR